MAYVHCNFHLFDIHIHAHKSICRCELLRKLNKKHQTFFFSNFNTMIYWHFNANIKMSIGFDVRHFIFYFKSALKKKF